MFPSNLHKNIAQLDRQISLLEKECENMETETRKKSTKSDSMHCKSSRNSNLPLKSPKVIPSLKKNDGLKRNKGTPPRSGRNQSSSSVHSQCSKSWNDNCETFSGRKSKSLGGNNYLQGCTCQTVNYTQHDVKKDCKARSSSCSEKKISDLTDVKNTCINKIDHILHKEVLIPNPGSTIEVTVTQKSNKNDSPVFKTINVANKVEKNVEKCKCQTKGPKWSELLCLESVKNKEMNNKNSARSETVTGDLVNPSFKCDLKVLEQNAFHRSDRNNENIVKEYFEAPVKLSPEVFKNKNNEINQKKLEKEMQCCLESNKGEDKKKHQSVVDTSKKKSPFYSPSRDLPEKINSNTMRSNSGLKNDFVQKLQLNCDNLVKDKEKLAEELATKENILKTMKKREEEYISLITGLKSNLAKFQEQRQENNKAQKELSTIIAKLEEQKKISENITNRHLSLQSMFERCALENHKLQTQIKLLKLESKKHDVLLAGKDAEINKYRDEIKNFQRLLSDHIALLKSSSQGLDAEKMMESIIQQSQFLFRSDLNFPASNQKDSSKPNPLMHSSPTSSKSSILNSSWDRISSIHGHDQSKGDSDFIINLKEDSNEKEFFQIFGEASSSNPKSSVFQETVKDKLPERENPKNSSSFTSCMSLRDGSESDSKNDYPEKDQSITTEDVNKVTLRKVKSNIDELLKNLKSKWSKEIFDSSGVNSTIKDFLNESQISSITQ